MIKIELLCIRLVWSVERPGNIGMLHPTEW